VGFLSIPSVLIAIALGAASAEEPRAVEDRRAGPAVPPRDSVALGEPSSGRLVRGVQVPRTGRSWSTWDPILKRSPNRPWRRWGTTRTVRRTVAAVRSYRRANPRAPRVAIGDLSRPRGGDFGPRYGLPGHASHQNGLDVDVYFPRVDRRASAPGSAADVDRELAQELVDEFVAAGAELVFVGPAVGLGGPPDVVQVLPNHDDHLHARFPDPG